MLLRLRAGRVGYFVPNFQNSSSQRVNPPTFEQYIPFVFSWINEYKRLRELDRILAESQFCTIFGAYSLGKLSYPLAGNSLSTNSMASSLLRKPPSSCPSSTAERIFLNCGPGA